MNLLRFNKKLRLLKLPSNNFRFSYQKRLLSDDEKVSSINKNLEEPFDMPTLRESVGDIFNSLMDRGFLYAFENNWSVLTPLSLLAIPNIIINLGFHFYGNDRKVENIKISADIKHLMKNMDPAKDTYDTNLKTVEGLNQAMLNNQTKDLIYTFIRLTGFLFSLWLYQNIPKEHLSIEHLKTDKINGQNIILDQEISKKRGIFESLIISFLPEETDSLSEKGSLSYFNVLYSFVQCCPLLLLPVKYMKLMAVPMFFVALFFFSNKLEYGYMYTIIVLLTTNLLLNQILRIPYLRKILNLPLLDKIMKEYEKTLNIQKEASKQSLISSSSRFKQFMKKT